MKQLATRKTSSPNKKRLSHRITAAKSIAILGLIFYNWWILVPLKPGLLRSSSELYSDLEVTGYPYATLMQRADLISGVLMLIAFLLLLDKTSKSMFKEWIGMVVFTISGALGGIFTLSCADSISATCRHLEITFQLPLHHYLHFIVGIMEFASISVVLFFAYQRTKHMHTRVARIYRQLALAALIAYPLLGIAYLTNHLGSIMEIVFFIGFVIIVLLQVYERSAVIKNSKV